jgi:UrcA family protein
MEMKWSVASAAILASSLVGATAIAQKTAAITVEATRIVETRVGVAPTGAPITSVSLSYGVSYDDLDPASYAGAKELEKRVANAAGAACKELSHQYPEAAPKEAECVKAATDKAMVKVHELEAAAAKKPAK